MTIDDIGQKVENGGVSAAGKLSAEELNTIVDQVKANRTQLAGLSEKFGHAVYEGGAIRFFDEPGGTELASLQLVGDAYTVGVVTNVDTIFSVLTGDTSTPIIISAGTKRFASVGAEGEDFPENYTYTVAVDTGTGYVVRIANAALAEGGSSTFDVRSWLVTGNNRIRISVTGATSGATKTVVLTATLTNLTLSVAHAWQKVWAEGSTYVVTGIRFSGNLQKTLHVKVGETELTQVFAANQNYTTTSTSFTLPANLFPVSGESGIGVIEIWMSAGTVETQHAKYNIMCMLENDTAPLVCINNIAAAAVNYNSDRLFSFAVANADDVLIQPVVSLEGEHSLPQLSMRVQEGDIYDYAPALELEIVSETIIGSMLVKVTPYDMGQVGIDTEVTLPFDNSLAFNATAGAVFYMNAALRSNGEIDRDVIKNAATNPEVAEYEAQWTGFGWSTDGWTVDEYGHQALVVPARCGVSIPLLKPFDIINEGLTLEMLVRSANIADEDTPVLSFLTERTVSGVVRREGFVLYPTKVVLLSTTSTSEILQGVGLCENVITHLTVTIQKAYNGMEGKNLATIYVNGIPNVSFDFLSSDTFGSAGFAMGQQATDGYLYMMRVYNFALEGQAVFNNFLNAIFEGTQVSRGEYDRERVRTENDVIDAGIDYQLAAQLGYNCMVVEPDDPNAPIPDFYHPYKDSSMPCTMRFEFGVHHEWDVKITNVPLDGQGTTSKRYYRWNLRGKLKKCNWYYTDGHGTTRGNYSEEPTFVDSKTGYMDGGPNGGVHPLIDRFTAKKNIASSQQGHKMGATALYDELFTEIGLKAELPDAEYRVAVWQYPFLGFVKRGDSYEFIGLYTAGPDKGCKETFGYDKKKYPSAMCIEGPNHAPRGTRFLHPWVDVDYDQDQETLTFGGEEAWDCDFCPYETAYDSDLTPGENAENKADVLALYEREWKPAYEIVFHCSPYIASISEMLASNPSYANIAAVNADITNFLNGTTTYTDWDGSRRTRSNLLMSFYDDNYDIWFYRNKTGQYENLSTVEGSSAHNIKVYLGLAGSPSTRQILVARKAKFDSEWGSYFSKQQTFYHKCFCLLIGAKDNDAKNSYPFKHRALADTAPGNRWGWKQDDLDSIHDTDNNGQATVKYSVEADDLNNGTPIFQGSNSAFWTIIWEWYADDLKTMMGTMTDGLAAIASSIGVSGSLPLHERVYAVLAHYFFDQSALYFPILAYQHDRTFGYVDAWFLGGQTIDGITYDTQYNGVEPLTQALGDRYQGERLWLERRIAYLFSKYSLGGFSSSMNGYNNASFTLNSAYTFHLIPAIDLYPAVNHGGGTLARAERTRAGQEAVVSMDADGQTTNYINGTDWLWSLGDLHDMVLASRGGSSDITFTVASARMRELVVGSATEEVLFNATSLVVAGPSFELIDARNVTSLNSAVNLRNCPRLREALFEGSTALAINIAEGSRVEVVSFPNSMTTLFLHSLNELTDENMKTNAAMFGTVQTFYFNGCDHINPLKLLTGIMNATYEGRRYITMLWNGTAEASAEDIAALALLAENVNTETPTEGNFGRVAYQNGETANVATQIPLIQGNIHPAGITQQQYDLIAATFPNIAFVGDYKLYLAFEDSRVWEICAYNWGDVVDKRGSVIASGELEGNGDTQVLSDYIFAPGLAIAARTEDGVSIPQKAARTVNYRLELEVAGASGEPWDIAAASAGTNVIFGVTQHPSNTSTTTTTHCSVDADNWANQSVLTKSGNKWIAEFTATNAAQYLRVAIRAAAGVKIRWSLIPLATGNACWQPVGITQAQCAAVSTLGTQFQYNQIITAFTELKLFAKIKSFSSSHFRQCFNLSKVKLPAGTTNVGSSFDRCDSIGTWNFYPDSLTTCAYCANMYIDTMIVPPSVTSVESRAWSGSSYKRVYMRWLVFEGATPPNFAGNPFYVDYGQIKIFVPDDSVEAYKAVSQLSSVKSHIYPISEFEDYFPGESYERVP